MKRKLIRVLTVVLAAVFVVSLVGVCVRLLDYRRGGESYAQAEELVQLPDFSQFDDLVADLPTADSAPAGGEVAGSGRVEEGMDASGAGVPSIDDAHGGQVYVDPYAEALAAMDFTALKEVNDDVLGWIVVPGTPISYPYLQGTDNDFYLNYTWQKEWSSMGSIFLEQTASPDLSDFNTIFYGHRMRNGSMFATLQYYNSYSYWASAPYVYVTDELGSYRYDIFASFEAGVTSMVYRLDLDDDAKKQEFIDQVLALSVIDTGIVPTVDDHIITLSTCTGNGYSTRWVVLAVRRDSTA